jgi:hypothetical protein
MGVWKRIGDLKGRDLETRDQGRGFKVDAVGENYRVVVPTTGDPRLIYRRAIEAACALGLDDTELTLGRLREEFPKDRNLSYILALMLADR